jgi:hypothetical protein
MLQTVSLGKLVCTIIKNLKANLNKQVSGELIVSNAKFRRGKLAMIADFFGNCKRRLQKNSNNVQSKLKLHATK